MTWTLSSDWCISRRIASQIKRSSTLEPPLTTSPRRRRTMLSTLVCISHPALFIYVSFLPFRDTRRQVYRQKLKLDGPPSRFHTFRGFASLFAYVP